MGDTMEYQATAPLPTGDPEERKEQCIEEQRCSDDVPGRQGSYALSRWEYQQHLVEEGQDATANLDDAESHHGFLTKNRKRPPQQ
mmetsp:Transcript_40368/g.75491  ORF Transcript_40368/g.75491 Transcript_40368/m.75491 type:complete len:85 (+) Transcript_40368:841-1095(+)